MGPSQECRARNADCIRSGQNRIAREYQSSIAKCQGVQSSRFPGQISEARAFQFPKKQDVSELVRRAASRRL
jgi:hypothetical protein